MRQWLFALSIVIVALASNGCASSGSTNGPAGRIGFAAEIDGNCRVVVADAIGAKEQEILRYPLDACAAPAFSPDGKSYAYADDPVSIARVDGTSVRSIPLPRFLDTGKPAWSPDSQKIAVNMLDTIYVVNADGTGKRTLFQSESGGGVREAAWSPDGRRIAFSRFAYVRFGVFQVGIYVIDVDGENGRWLRRGFESEHLSWSPDGKQLAYKDVPSDSIYRINLNGTGKRRLAAGEAPSWSPDGRYIAFSREHTIWTMKADGSSQRKAWPSFCFCGHPDWLRP